MAMDRAWLGEHAEMLPGVFLRDTGVFFVGFFDVCGQAMFG